MCFGVNEHVRRTLLNRAAAPSSPMDYAIKNPAEGIMMEGYRIFNFIFFRCPYRCLRVWVCQGIELEGEANLATLDEHALNGGDENF